MKIPTLLAPDILASISWSELVGFPLPEKNTRRTYHETRPVDVIDSVEQPVFLMLIKTVCRDWQCNNLPALLIQLGLALSWVIPDGLYGQDKLPESWKSDATLRSIHFVDHDYGWAVGDRGTILRTEDGGRTWQSISTPRDVIWTNVQFIDEKVGWISGGYFRGALGRSIGITIKTEDGGKTWKNCSPAGIPFVEQMTFVDHNEGWMFCKGNSIYTCGLLVTRDGGTSWNSAPGVLTRKLQTGVQTDRGRFAGWDQQSNWVEFDRTGIRFQEKLNSRGVDHISVTKAGRIVLIDHGKLKIRSNNHGFVDIPLDLEPGTVDWTRTFCKGDQIWAVGSPGSFIVHSPDRGETWTHHRTGVLSSLKSVFFLDSERGWAVGDFGKIIATKDGGVTWKIQRNPELRLGVLNLAGRRDRIATHCLSLLSGTFNHRCGVAILSNEKDQAAQGRWQAIQGLNRIGVSSFHHQTVDSEKSLYHAVRLLRSSRPSVLVIDADDRLMDAIVSESVAAAADPKIFPQLSDLGVLPWQVEKVIAVSTRHDLDHTVATNQYSAHLGRTVSLQSRFASELLNRFISPGASNPVVPPNHLNWKLVLSNSRSQLTNQGMTTGTAAYNHPDCRRRTEKVQIDNMQQFRSIANWSQNLALLTRLDILSPFDEKGWVDQVTAATSGMDLLSLTFFLEDLEKAYTQYQKPIMADHTARLILQKALDSEVGERTLWKMIQRYGSSEANHELNRLVRERIARQGNSLADSRVRPASAIAPIDPVRPTGRSSGTPDLQEVDVTLASYQNANQLIGIFQREFPGLNANPQFQVPIAWWKEKVGQRSTFQRVMDSAGSWEQQPLEYRRVQREKELRSKIKDVADSIPVYLVQNREIVLDGVLNERPWAIDKPGKTEFIRYAKDDEFFYACGSYKIDSRISSHPGQKRVRDESLTGFDRVQIFLDFDRDYCSGIELSVDTRGCCNDALWRDNVTKDFSYNPTWYVASRINRDRWSFEFAIPLKELPVLNPGGSLDWIVSSRLTPGNTPAVPCVSTFLEDEKLLTFALPKQGQNESGRPPAKAVDKVDR